MLWVIVYFHLVECVEHDDTLCKESACGVKKVSRHTVAIVETNEIWCNTGWGERGMRTANR